MKPTLSGKRARIQHAEPEGSFNSLAYFKLPVYFILHVRMLQNREQHVPVLGAVVPHVVLERVVEDDRVPVAAVRTRLVANGERDAVRAS